MKLTLKGVLSVDVGTESLFQGQPLPVVFECEIDRSSINFDEDNKVRLDVAIPAQLSVPEAEWQRAVGELLARELLPQAES